MAGQGVQLIPSQEEIMQILKRTGAFREGHFVYPNGKHTAHYFQMPLAFRYYDTARVLAVALSRKFRVERDVASQLPKVAIISPTRSAPSRFTGPNRKAASGCSGNTLIRARSIPALLSTTLFAAVTL